MTLGGSSTVAAVDYDKIAPYHDALVRDRSDVPFFRSLAARAAGPVAEFMAGSGRVSTALAEVGVDLTCVDSSAKMLTLLRAKLAVMNRSVRLVCDDVTRVDLGTSYRLIFIAFHSFEELATDEAGHACLANARRHLDGAGRFVCTLHDVPSRLGTVGPGKEGRWSFVDPRSRGEITLVLDTSYDSATGIVSGVETLSAGGVPILSLPMRFRLLRPATFTRLAHEAGFAVESIRGDFTESPYEENRNRTAVWTLRPVGTA
jgi:SAM-dependent methyltransferase